MNKINVAIIGAGRIGRTHTENIKRFIPYANIKIVADIFADTITDWSKSQNIESIFDDPKKAINDPEIDVVFICSPTDTHYNYTIEAARAGKDIFCEKPIDLDANRIKEALKVIEKSEVKFQVGFHKRYDHNFKKAQELISKGKVGNINIIKITSWDLEPPPIEYTMNCGGIFLDQTIHDFDLARFLTGSEVVEVFSNAAVRINPDIGNICKDFDTAITNLKFKNGIIGVIDNCRRAAHGHVQKVEVLGSEGTINIQDDTPSNIILSNDQGVCHEKPFQTFMDRYANAYVDEIKDFFDAISNNRKPSVGIIDGLKSVEIGTAALKSVRENRPIKIE